MRTLALLVFSVVVAGQLSAAEAKKVTLNISGVECGGCAKALGTELEGAGLKLEGKLLPSKASPSRIVATAAEDLDLGGVAAKLAKVAKPHKDVPGALSVVLFAKFDKASGKKAEEALAKVAGVDKKGIVLDEKKGEISVKLAGGEKVTAMSLVDALKKDAGLAAELAMARPALKVEPKPAEKKPAPKADGK